MTKSKKSKDKAKLNLTVRGEQLNKLEQMASLEKRSVSNLVEIMADERWERLVEQQGIVLRLIQIRFNDGRVRVVGL